MASPWVARSCGAASSTSHTGSQWWPFLARWATSGDPACRRTCRGTPGTTSCCRVQVGCLGLPPPPMADLLVKHPEALPVLQCHRLRPRRPLLRRQSHHDQVRLPTMVTIMEKYSVGRSLNSPPWNPSGCLPRGRVEDLISDRAEKAEVVSREAGGVGRQGWCGRRKSSGVRWCGRRGQHGSGRVAVWPM